MRPKLIPLLLLLVVVAAVGIYLWAGSPSLAPPAAGDSAPDPVGSAIPMPADAAPATVNYVHDGDTIFLSTAADPNLKVRLLAVDTPEIGENAECYGDVATDFTRSLLPEGATVYTASDVSPLDQYGRALLFVWTESGELVNYSLVAGGYAEAVFIGENRLHESEFEAAEDVAMNANSGIWGSC